MGLWLEELRQINETVIWRVHGSLASHIDPVGGSVGVSDSAMPEVDFSYFFTDSVAVELIATSTCHTLTANNTSLRGLLGNKIVLGSTYVLPPALVLQYHFMPHERFSPYLRFGVDVAWFYDTNTATGVVPGTNVPVVLKLGLSIMVGPVLDAGFDYNLSGPWFANFVVRAMLMQTTARVHTAVGLVTATDQLDPLVVSAGISYRF